MSLCLSHNMPRLMRSSYQGGFQGIREVTYRSFLQVPPREPSGCCMKTLQYNSLSAELHTAHSPRYLPHVVVARPMTDLCATCQKNSAAIVCSVNLSEEKKSEVTTNTTNYTHTTQFLFSSLKTAEEHLMRATCEQSLYRTVVKHSRDGIRQHFTTTNDEALSSAANNAALSSLPSTVFSPPPPGSCMPSGSGPACVHYIFDFAQQVHYPHNPLQPGPMYFKTARKCAIFGVCCKGLPRQINYISY